MVTGAQSNVWADNSDLPYVLRMGEEKHQPHAQSSLVSQQVFTECLDCAQC